MLGTAKKTEVNQVLGSPTSCKKTAEGLEECEYRTAAARNYPVPDAHKKQEAMGPDLSPYEYFDVLHVYYDSLGILKNWVPIVIRK